MDFEKLSSDWENMFRVLKKKREIYDPRSWESLWPGWPARWVLKFLGQAMVASTDSTCLNRHTGACLVDIKRQQNGDLAPFSIAACFNGAPTGIKPCSKRGRCYYKDLAFQEFKERHQIKGELPEGLKDEFREFKKGFFQFCLACHAEANAIYFSPLPTFGKILFTTTDPCPGCAKTMVQNGIGAVVFAEPYKENESGPFLAEQTEFLFEEANIPCLCVEVPENYFLWLTESIKNAGQSIFDPECDPVTN